MFLVSLLPMFLISCRTTERVIYVPEIRVIEIDFPEFPKLGEYEITADGKVTTSEDFFRQLLIFKLHYKDVQNLYDEKKRLYEGEEK